MTKGRKVLLALLIVAVGCSVISGVVYLYRRKHRPEPSKLGYMGVPPFELADGTVLVNKPISQIVSGFEKRVVEREDALLELSKITNAAAVLAKTDKLDRTWHSELNVIGANEIDGMLVVSRSQLVELLQTKMRVRALLFRNIRYSPEDDELPLSQVATFQPGKQGLHWVVELQLYRLSHRVIHDIFQCLDFDSPNNPHLKIEIFRCEMTDLAFLDRVNNTHFNELSICIAPQLRDVRTTLFLRIEEICCLVLSGLPRPATYLTTDKEQLLNLLAQAIKQVVIDWGLVEPLLGPNLVVGAGKLTVCYFTSLTALDIERLGQQVHSWRYFGGATSSLFRVQADCLAFAIYTPYLDKKNGSPLISGLCQLLNPDFPPVLLVNLQVPIEVASDDVSETRTATNQVDKDNDKAVVVEQVW